MQKNVTKHKEFSKLIVFSVFSLFLLCVLFGFWLCFKSISGNDYMTAGTIFGSIIVSIGAITGTTFGFYYWKAKAENIIKNSKKLTDEDIDKIKELSQSLKDGY